MAHLGDAPAGSSERRPTVALVCPAPRWRRILALALEADGLLVCDWTVAAQPSASSPGVIVADLDSLGCDAAEAIGRLGGDTPVLLISVYPQQLDQLNNGRRPQVAALQPPFRWRELTRRVRCLLRASRTQQA
jgi:DNA-binding response OmpR family regulator